MVDSSFWVFCEGGSEEVKGRLNSGEVDFLEDVGGVGGGVSNLGDDFHFCFFLVTSLKCVSISTSSKARREPKSAKASMAIVTLPWVTIQARCSRAAEVLEGSITFM